MKICCVKNDLLPSEWITNTCALPVGFFEVIKQNDISWLERSQAETNVSFRQIIPYILIRNCSGQFLCYPRHGSEKRLNGLYSLGLGGHVEETDKKLQLEQTIETGLQRELTEELANYNPDSFQINYKGIINETESEVGLVHLGLVFVAQCTNNYIPTPAEETKGAEWKSQEELAHIQIELWSKLALQLISSGKISDLNDLEI
jgi:predicted NUDIX family phosphoesterase